MRRAIGHIHIGSSSGARRVSMRRQMSQRACKFKRILHFDHQDWVELYAFLPAHLRLVARLNERKTPQGEI
jgi:hypothetical protein